MDKEQQIHEMTMDYLHSRFSKHTSVEEYLEHYKFAYGKIEQFISQSEILKKQ